MENINKQKINIKLLQEKIDANLLNGSIEITLLNRIYKDKLIDEKRTEPHFKPGFARDTILSQNYIGQFIAVKTDFIKIHQDILNNLNKNIIYDIILQISEKTRKIEHIQKILYHETIENRKIDRRIFLLYS